MQKYQEQILIQTNDTLDFIDSLKRCKGSFSMTWAALVDIYLYTEKIKRGPPSDFFTEKVVRILLNFLLHSVCLFRM